MANGDQSALSTMHHPRAEDQPLVQSRKFSRRSAIRNPPVSDENLDGMSARCADVQDQEAVAPRNPDSSAIPGGANSVEHAFGVSEAMSQLA